MDSNHRSRRRRIYSPLHLTALQPTLIVIATWWKNVKHSHAMTWSWWSESNQQPADYKSAALPLSHTSMNDLIKMDPYASQTRLVPWGGIEPPTRGFSVPCSTDWATKAWQVHDFKIVWRLGRDSNSRPPPWQGGVLTNWTTEP